MLRSIMIATVRNDVIDIECPLRLSGSVGGRNWIVSTILNFLATADAREGYHLKPRGHEHRSCPVR
jgi:hypothetical protein